MLTIITLGFFAAPLSAQNILTVHDGTATNGFVPVYGYYADAYLKAEFVYPASELVDITTNNDPIIGLKFYAQESNVSWGSANFQVFLTEVADATISSYVGSSNATIVYEGSLSIVDGEMEIEFTTPYAYNGGNLLVGVYSTATGTYVTSTWIGESVSGASIQGYGYSSGDISATQRNFLPKTTFTYGVITCPKPTAFNATIVSPTEVMLTWNGNDDASSYNVEYGAPGFTPGEGTGTVETAYTNTINITTLTEGVTYDYYVQADCGSDGTSIWVGPITLNTSQYMMAATGSDTVTTCSLLIYDNGGPDGDYSTNSNSTLVLYPAIEGSGLYISGPVSTYNAYSYYEGVLTIYAGVGTDGTVLGTYSGVTSVNLVYGGPVTIKFTSGSYYAGSGYELSVSCVDCFAPSGITITDVTTESATVNWTAASTSSNYLVHVTNGANTTIYEASGETLDLNNLSPASSYTVQIQTLCDDGDTSLVSLPSHFNTACAPITVTNDTPWFEDFEGYAGGGEQPFICWETPVHPNGPFVYCGHSPSCHSGSNSAEFKGAENLLVMPEFSNDIHELRLSFWATATAPALGAVEIGVITDPTDPTTFELLGLAGDPGPRGGSGSTGNGNYMGPFAFNGIQAASGRIALRYTNTDAYASWNLDDFTVELAPACNSPVKTSVTATNIDGHNATISWVDNDETHSSWTVYYKESDDVDYTAMAPTSDTFLVLTDLDPETTYTVYVVTNCNGVPSEDATIPYNFTTLVACPAPAALTISALASDEVTITWNGTASSYNVEYGEPGYDTLGTGIQTVVTDNSITIDGLTPNTTYIFNVNADCTDANDGISATSSITFTTTQIPVDLPYTADFSTAAEWKLNNGTCANYWTVGTVGTEDALFVTNDGSTPGYNTSSTSVVTAEKLFTVGDAAELVIAFDLEVGGESSSYGYDYDFMKLLLAPATQEYPASTSTPSWATYASTEYAYNFSNYLSSTGSNNGNNYKISKTNNMLHIEAIMPNPNAEPDASSTAKVVFVWRNDGSSGVQPGAVISNLQVSVLSCSAPTNIAVEDVTTTGVTLSWDGEADGYSVCLIGGGDTAYYTATTNALDIIDLTPSTQYTVYLRALCGSDSSILSTPYYFASACDAIMITAESPWFENFEGYVGSGAQSVGACWATPEMQQVDNGMSPFVYCGYSGSTYSGVNSLEMKGGPTMVVFPEFGNDINTLRISMWGNTTAANASSAGNMVLGYISDIYDATTFVAVDTIPATAFNRTGTDAPHANFIGPYDLDGVTPQPGLRIALRLTDVATYTTGGSTSWNLDDITVSLIPDCPSPVKTSVAITDVDAHNATVSFTDDDLDHNSWTVYYKASNDVDWSTVMTSTTMLILTNLDPETTYEVYVVTNCNGTPSEDATNHKTFTTDIACFAPQNVTVSNIEMTTATVTWTSDAASFTLEYGEAGFTPGAGTSVTVTDNTYDLSGLTAGTVYTVYVTADCGGDDGSSSPASVNFNTTLCEVENQCAFTFNLSDSWGDGWNGGTLSVIQNGVTVATLGLTSGNSGTETVNLCHDVAVTLSWNAGNYSSEASFTLIGPDGAQLYASPTMDNFPDTGYVFTPNCAACAMPSALVASNIDLNTATVSWTGSANSYNIEYGEVGFVIGTGTTATVTTTTYNLTGLTAGTAYTVYVASDCGAEGTSVPASVNFSTPICALADQCAYTFVLSDNYGDGWNGGSLAVQQNGITVAELVALHHGGGSIASHDTVTVNLCDNISTSLVWTSGNYDYEASFSLIGPDGSEVYSFTGMDNYTTYTFTTDCNGTGPVIVTPTVVTDAATNVTQTTATMNGTVTNPSGVDVTPMGFEWKESSAISYTVVNVTGAALTHDLSGLTAGTQYSYKAFITYNGLTYYGDEVTFTTTAQGQPTEPSATTAPATAVGQTTATLNGSVANPDNVTITAQGFEWKATSASTYTTVNATGATMTYNLTGLTASTNYTYRAFVTTANGTHYGQDVTFTTEEEPVEPCDVPTGLMATDVQSESISITWDNAPALRWNLQYGPVGGTLASATATTNSYTFTNLTPLTTYQIQVQAVCDEGNVSEWSPAIEVTTTNLNSYLENNVTLYPNPAKEFVDVRVDGDVNVIDMEVYDVYGKLINTVNVIDNMTRINVSGMANGMYFVRVKTEQGMVTKRFVKK